MATIKTGLQQATDVILCTVYIEMMRNCVTLQLLTSSKTSDRVFAVAAPTTWNRLPQKVRTATTTVQFSRALKTHLFNLDWSRAHSGASYSPVLLMNYGAVIQIYDWLIVYELGGMYLSSISAQSSHIIAFNLTWLRCHVIFTWSFFIEKY